MSTPVAIVAGVAAGGAVLGVGYLGWRWYRRRRAVSFITRMTPSQRNAILNSFPSGQVGPQYV